MRLKDKAVLIAGAGPGIGRAVARLFAAEGARVALADRDEASLKKTSELVGREGVEVVTVPGDATRIEDVQRMVESTVHSFGSLDVLYNNISGGWVELGKPMHEVSAEAQERIVSNNLAGIVNLCRAGVEQMLRQGRGGSIINVSASRNVRRQSNAIYAYTKAGIIELTIHMAADYARSGIRVNCVMPGLLMTREVNEVRLQPIRNQLVRAQPLTARQGDPLDVAYACVYLASDEASFVTGQCLGVEGGDDTKLMDVVIDSSYHRS